MKQNIIVGIILIGALIGAWFIISGAPSVSQVGGNAFLDGVKNAQSAVVLDVRTPEEFTAGHIAQAINVDFEASSFLSEIQKLDKTVPYYIYCRSGNRSGQAIQLMIKNGFREIVELRGGIVSNPNIVLIPSSQEALTGVQN